MLVALDSDKIRATDALQLEPIIIGEAKLTFCERNPITLGVALLALNRVQANDLPIGAEGENAEVEATYLSGN